jgi:hypothetical protein
VAPALQQIKSWMESRDLDSEPKWRLLAKALLAASGRA